MLLIVAYFTAFIDGALVLLTGTGTGYSAYPLRGLYSYTCSCAWMGLYVHDQWNYLSYGQSMRNVWLWSECVECMWCVNVHIECKCVNFFIYFLPVSWWINVTQHRRSNTSSLTVNRVNKIKTIKIACAEN